jgi:hypothetical protein
MEEIEFYKVWHQVPIVHRYYLLMKLNVNVDNQLEISNHHEEMRKAMQI